MAVYLSQHQRLFLFTLAAKSYAAKVDSTLLGKYNCVLVCRSLYFLLPGCYK